MKKLAFIFILFASTLWAEHKTLICSACHGLQGISANPEWPNLAGQNSTYLIKQLNDMKAGTHRSASSMAGIVASLDQQDIDALAVYYAKMPAAQGSTPKQFIKRGEQLYRGGDLSKHITACIACHGPKGTGNAQAGFPLIAGQHAAYTIMQLNAFKKKSRTNDLNHIMHDISSRMNDDDIEAIAHYIEGLY
jgi:cytochrome c553